MSSKPDALAERDQDLDETIERQMSTTGVTGVMRTLRSHAAADGVVDAADEIDDEYAETIVIPPPDAVP